MDRTEFGKLVGMVGGRERAAEIMGVTKACVAQALTYGPDGAGGKGASHGPVLGPAKLLELKRAAGVLERPPQVSPGGGAGDATFLELEVLRGIARYEIGRHPDGFQRPRNERRVAAIEAALRQGAVRFGAIEVGRLPDGTLVEIDGGHRREAFIRAGVGCWALVYDVPDLQQARLLYLVRNTEQVKPRPEELFRASRNPLSQSTRLLQEFYGLTFPHVHALVAGLLGRRVDFVDEDASLDADTQARAEALLDAWTKDPRWGRDEAPTFNDARFLRALGHFSRTYDAALLGRAVQLIRESRPEWFYRNGKWTLSLRQPSRLSALLASYVNPHLMGGITGRRANRVRPT